MAGVLSTGKAPRGGKRPNAGRKKSDDFKYDPSHAKRPDLFFKHPVHVMLRVLSSVPRLRQRDGYEAIREALLYFVDGASFRVVHISIQRNHLHLVVEAAHKEALARGMQRFAIRAARALNAAFEREGKVFAFRYKAKQIKTAHYARNVIAYVLNNWRKHHEDRRYEGMPFDRFTSAEAFAGWTTGDPGKPPDFGLPVSPPRTELLVFDWQLFGLIDPFEVPGQVM
ncbi:MAG TPA: transposase [Kofleriaceae bacterium]|nr:transposase [Kofleriaceae bacterium]